MLKIAYLKYISYHLSSIRAIKCIVLRQKLQLQPVLLVYYMYLQLVYRLQFKSLPL